MWSLIDRDQGQHLSRVFDFYPPGIDGLVLGEDPAATLRIVDTAPEANADRAVGYLREAEWALVPVKGPWVLLRSQGHLSSDRASGATSDGRPEGQPVCAIASLGAVTDVGNAADGSAQTA